MRTGRLPVGLAPLLTVFLEMPPRIAMSSPALNVELEKTGPGSEFRDCANGCPEMIVVPAGTFTMGSPQSESWDPEFETDHTVRERPQHEVTLAKPFAVSKLEVTFDDWDACVAR